MMPQFLDTNPDSATSNILFLYSNRKLKTALNGRLYAKTTWMRLYTDKRSLHNVAEDLYGIPGYRCIW